jgi:RNA polymerase sigma-70 factor (family 1)
LETEKQILLHLSQGQHHAFEQIYHLYKRPLVQHLLYLFNSAEMAEEVAQDTFVTIWQQHHKIDPHQSFRAYLYTIATNKVYNTLRKAAYDAELSKKLHPFYLHSDNLVEEYINKRENEQLVRDLLAQMPPKQREVFQLAKLEGYSYQEISEKLSISPNTINTHLKRAQLFLKEKLRDKQEWLGFLIISTCECLT